MGLQVVWKANSGTRCPTWVTATLEPYSKYAGSYAPVAAAQNFQFGGVSILLRSGKGGSFVVASFAEQLGKRTMETKWAALVEAGDDFVKITHSEPGEQDVLGAYQTANWRSLKIRAVMPGSTRHQHLIQNHFGHLHVGRGWFRLDRDIQAFLSHLDTLPNAIGTLRAEVRPQGRRWAQKRHARHEQGLPLFSEENLIIVDPSEFSLGPVVYFFEEKGTGYIKIGRTDKNIRQRMSTLRGGNCRQLKLVAVLSGDRWTEMNLHDHFFESRLRGEWFRPTDELTGLIAVIASKTQEMVLSYFNSDESLPTPTRTLPAKVFRTVADVAAEMKRREHYVPGSSRVRGELHGRHRLSREDVLQIWEKAGNGSSSPSLAAEHGVSPRTISLILEGKNWSWLTSKLPPLPRHASVVREKSVRCLSNGAEFPSIAEAARAMCVPVKDLVRVCKGERRAVCGLRFEFIYLSNDEATKADQAG